MDYIYSEGDQKIIIEVEQRDTRHSIIEQYVQCRKMQGITQAELAKRAGVPRTNITRFESGKYNPFSGTAGADSSGAWDVTADAARGKGMRRACKMCTLMIVSLSLAGKVDR